ncbi:MAG TPA: F0F1 ATP synthase subunit epsilon [Verrucomicrobiae bacterium]|nr:F0F1 ATP synthase subunit epsilon [Verrucomicrobiae bacterium]
MADDKTFPFEILTLQKLFLRQNVRFVIAPGQEGLFEILANHAPFVFALKPGALRMRIPDGNDQYVAIGGGFLVVQRERTTVLTRSAERPEEIDVTRAQRAKERAEQRLQARTADIDIARAQAALLRALARLAVAEYADSEGLLTHP